MMTPTYWFAFLTLISCVGTAYGIRLLLPFITSIPWTPVMMLDEWFQLRYETETYVYMVSAILFIVFFLIGLMVRSIFHTYNAVLGVIARRGIWAMSLAILFQPWDRFLVPTTPVTIFGIIFGYVAVWGIERFVLRRPLSYFLTSSLLAILFLKESLPAFFALDTGVNPQPLMADYLFVMLTIIGLAGLWLFTKDSRINKTMRVWFSKPVLAIALGVGLTIMLLRLMIVVLDTDIHTNYDMYLIVSPAYNFVRGATPLVNSMSMYGVLSLLPWILWLILFPSLPVSPAMLIVVTTMCVIVYYLFLTFVMGKLIKSRIVYPLVVLSAFYFSFMVRAYVPGDAASLLSFPATTPLRFGMFLVPLLPVVLFVRTGNTRYLRTLLLISIGALLFSFELGVGWFASGVLVTALSLLLTKPSLRKKEAMSLIRFFAISFTYFILGVVGFTLLRSGKFPDISTYTFYSRFFGASGYYMLPVEHQIAFWAHVLTAGIAGVWGIYLLLVEQARYGLVVTYVSLILMSIIPYYMGRSLFQTLFGISMPMVILWGMIADHALARIKRIHHNPAAIAIALVMFAMLFTTSWRTVYQSIRLWARNSVAEQVDSITSFVTNAVIVWPLKATPQYAFVKANLPPGCPLVSFDHNEYELPPALGVKPALNYPALRYFVMAQEQINAFQPTYRNGFYCLFMNKREYEGVVTYGIYEYYWIKIANHATIIAEDPERGFVLYKISQY